jgi:integrase
MIPTFGAKTMSHPTTIEPTGKSATRGGNGPTTAGLRKPEPRERKGTVLIDRLCETPVTEREKYFDRKCGGLYVSIVPPCVTSFCINYTDGAGRAKSGKFAVYHPDSFRVANARARVYALKAMGGAAIGALLRQQKVTAVKHGITMDQLIEKRIEAISAVEMKDDGEMRPTVESCQNIARHLRNLVSPRLGQMIAREVGPDDIATLSADIEAGRYIVDGKARKPSRSNARHMRRGCSAMFKWAMEPGDHHFVDANPCVNLPKLKRERPKTRVLSEAEIAVLWRGLDRDDLPFDRRIRLAIRFALTSMLRSNELLPIHKNELDIENRIANIPARRVKKRRLIRQPLSDLALEIIKESMGDNDYAFAGRFGDAPLARQAMSNALKGDKKAPGICALLGLKPFTPHDLRRTSATMCEHLRLPGGDVALCLDHQSATDENGNDWPAVTQDVYSLGFEARVARKRVVLDAWAVELRRIIAEPATGLRLAA